MTACYCAHCKTRVEADDWRLCDACREVRSPWLPDVDAIERARIAVGLTSVVVVKAQPAAALHAGPAHDRREVLGRYKGLRPGPTVPADPTEALALGQDELARRFFHLVHVSNRLTTVQASRAIWHELAHATQYETIPDFEEQYAAYQAREHPGRRPDAAYLLNPFEVEAAVFSGFHYECFALTVKNPRGQLPHDRTWDRGVVECRNGAVVVGPDFDASERQAMRRILRANKALGRIT